MKKPNIVLFSADGIRRDCVHVLGSQSAWTPNLDALAKEGVAFRNAYCQSTVSVPCRCSYMSGLYPHTTGHRTMHYLLRKDEPNLLKSMQEQWYEVIWIGRNDLIPGNRAKSECCDAYYDGIHDIDTKDWNICLNTTGRRITLNWNETDYSFYNEKASGQEKIDEKCVESCLKYLGEKKRKGDDKPFFIYCSLSFPHPPYGISEPLYSLIDRNHLPPRRPWCPDKPDMLVTTADRMNLHDWEEDEWNELRAVYMGMVAEWDSHLGKVINKLKELDFYDNTSIFAFSDHGDYIGDYDIVETLQNCFEDSLTNVPLIIRPARQFSCVPRTSNAFVELTDISATIMDMCEGEMGCVTYGKSLMHVLAGDEEHADAVFCEGGRPDGDVYAMESGHDDPKDPYWPRLSVQQEEGPHERATMIRMGHLKYIMRMHGQDELYDLDLDPLETVNRIDDPSYGEPLLKMKLRMLEWYQQTADWIPSRKEIR